MTYTVWDLKVAAWRAKAALASARAELATAERILRQADDVEWVSASATAYRSELLSRADMVHRAWAEVDFAHQLAHLTWVRA